ncbi:FHA domain-containing protein [Actinomycetospora termitidis]|uniref:FHA domain-containing protein n=1 Tax=Actinomycetospora termitidis TaxID=3053470 RepID=A0ABT7M213_9PSEU|nr:FHA domain-containing protein [Actinomycetospora sp. Odt1-22]MDL5154698.1 FHA domain-containing protein [Actinomycetospora sp. Odt1-22]
MTRWCARVWADRDHYELVRAREDRSAPVPEFPGEPREFTVDLDGDEIAIGRRPVPDEGRGSGETSATDPGIDLTGPPRDPGVSHLHAVLLAVGDDRWVVLDAGSTNGTTLNYGGELLTPGTPVPLDAGDTIHVGAWTTITVERR